MGDVLFTDFKNKTGHYTKGGGIDDLELMAIEIMNQIDTAPCEMPPVQPSYTAPDRDPA